MGCVVKSAFIFPNSIHLPPTPYATTPISHAHISSLLVGRPTHSSSRSLSRPLDARGKRNQRIEVQEEGGGGEGKLATQAAIYTQNATSFNHPMIQHSTVAPHLRRPRHQNSGASGWRAKRRTAVNRKSPVARVGEKRRMTGARKKEDQGRKVAVFFPCNRLRWARRWLLWRIAQHRRDKGRDAELRTHSRSPSSARVSLFHAVLKRSTRVP